MSKSKVYSWRLNADRKQALDSAARRQDLTTAELLDRITDGWLAAEAQTVYGESEQERLRRLALRSIGAFDGGDPKRSVRARAAVKARLDRPGGAVKTPPQGTTPRLPKRKKRRGAS